MGGFVDSPPSTLEASDAEDDDDDDDDAITSKGDDEGDANSSGVDKMST